MKNLCISAGQPGRLVFNLSEGVNDMKPVGYVAVTEYPGARPVATAMRWVAADHALYLPPLPFGCFFYEVRLGSLEVAKGHIDVAPTPFPYDEQEFKTWVVTDGDIVNDVATFNIDAAPGLQGPQGERGETGEKGDTGASAYQLAAQYGYTGTEAEWIAELQGAQGAATAAKDSAATATTAAATATEARTAATTAAAAATEASTAAAAAAEEAAATTADTAKTAQNNTFTGTNTFNGVLVANEGVKVNYVEPAFNSVLPSKDMSTIGLLNESLIKEIDVKGSLVSASGTFSGDLELSGAAAEAPAVMQKIYPGRSFHHSYKSYYDYNSFVLPIESNNCDFRVMLVMNSYGNAYTVQYSDITKPFYSWEKPLVANSHFHVFEVYVTYQSGQQSIHCTTRWIEGDNVLGVREFGARLNGNSLSSNYVGITHLFFIRESKGVGLYVLFSDASIRFMRVGNFDCKHGLYSSSELKTLLVGATGRVKLKNMKMAVAISGAVYPNFPYPLSKTYDAYENLLTFEEYKQKYGITDATE